ncbi:MAG: class I SAM-dependent methyltransferase [Gemmatimonadetes bacterium]|nr:class I SAM-dependent methyltransferase [Gemmatimonadota bacterium]
MRADRILAEVRGPRVLDVGCASTNVRPDSPRWIHRRLVERFERVWGIDRSVENVARMREADYRRTIVADAMEFALTERFDTIVAGEVIEHLENPGRFLDRARDHLAPGGRIVLTTPYPFALFNVLYAFLKYPKTCENEDHVVWLCPRTMEELARRRGLAVDRWEAVEDYKPESDSRPYRWFVRGLGAIRPVVPKRLRCNALLFVLRKVGEAEISEPRPTAARR